MSDAGSATAASNRIAWDTSTSGDAVRSKVENGMVTLTGEVEWPFQKEVAEREVRNVIGVIDVSNQITIKSRVDIGHLRMTSNVHSTLRSSFSLRKYIH
jgi:osmotically-inducible protein OsmY